ncbi:natural resistance-associated macrophage protein-domain-containing protein, partial [Absidia repens]
MPIKQLVRAGTYMRRLAKYIGPGFMIAVGYIGSRFGCCITTILTTTTQFVLYVLAEIAIIATDVAEVIGSAIALTLLFPSMSLPVGVAITAADVFIILMFYKEDQDMRLVRYFEWFVMALVSAVGICFIIELALSPVVMGDVMKGFLPSAQIFTDPECLYVAIGIIGATVMPHNLFLHSFIVQSRCHTWRSERPYVVESNNNNSNNQQQSIDEEDGDDGTLFLADDMDDGIEKTEEHEAIYMMSSFNNNNNNNSKAQEDDTATTPLTHSNSSSSSSSSSTSISDNYERNMTELRQQLATH